MSKIQVDEIVNKLDNGATSFPRGISGTTASFSGNVSIGGTLTYEDVTNIDSVGLITARSGVRVTSGGIDAVGVITARDSIDAVGVITARSGIQVLAGGINAVGVITASSLSIGGKPPSSLGIGIGTTGGIVGYGATLINLYGTGVSTSYYDSNVGIATIYFEGGGGGGGATNGYVAGITAFLS